MRDLVLKPNNIITYSKVQMSPIAPQQEDILIKDIAHSLSYMCRANGHIKNFFSVAQHCINCCLEAKERGYSKKVQLALLLHDASEAYLADITRPVKHNLEKYLEIESILQDTIYKTFGVGELTEEEKELIDEIDNVMLQHEFINLADLKIFKDDIEIVGKYSFDFKDFLEVEQEYIALFNSLTVE